MFEVGFVLVLVVVVVVVLYCFVFAKIGAKIALYLALSLPLVVCPFTYYMLKGFGTPAAIFLIIAGFVIMSCVKGATNVL